MYVKELITQKNHAPIDKDRLVTDAMKFMKKYRVSRLPVTENGKLVGIITEADIADRLGSSKQGGRMASSVRISSVMSTKPRTIPAETTVTEAAKILLDNDISGLPVLEGEKILGLITKRDLIRLCERVEDILVSDVMTRDPKITSTMSRLVKVQDQMRKNRISSMPVIEDGKVVGLITRWQIARAFLQLREDAISGKYIDNRIRELLVEEFMIKNPPTLTATDTVADASLILQKKYLHSVPILDSYQHLTGIISRTDLVKLVANNYKI
ncbi:MAG: CBS domain-containing protein [Candidatus Ranarchaeia archaeon]